AAEVPRPARERAVRPLFPRDQRMKCESAQPLAQRRSCVLPSFDVALWRVRHLLWTAVALPPLGSGQGTLLVSVAHCLLVRRNAPKRERKSRLKCEISEKPACNATGKQTSFLVYREQWVRFVRK